MSAGGLPTRRRLPTCPTSRGISIPAALVNHVEQSFAFVETLELVQKELHRAFQPIRRVIGTVWREQHVFQGVEGMTFGQGLGVEDVEGRAADAIGSQRIRGAARSA